MDFNDAIIITLLGMSVVFVGLILTSLLISSFSIFPRWFKRDQSVTAPTSIPAEPSVPAPELDPDTLAVITAVLEVELRLYQLHHGQKLTIARYPSASAWARDSR